MKADQPATGSPQGRTPGGGLGRWLRLAGAALLLLAVSQTIWLWQTWPVRELLDPAQPATPLASRR